MKHLPSLSTHMLAGLVALLMAIAVAAGSSAHAQSAVDALPFKNHAQEVRFQKLTSQLRCLVCQDESLAASNADLAKQMRLIVFQQMQKGWTNDQIKQYLVDRYSDYVLYKPPLKPSTWLLWFGPGIILLAGAAVVVVTVRKRRHGPVPEVPDPDDDEW